MLHTVLSKKQIGVRNSKFDKNVSKNPSRKMQEINPYIVKKISKDKYTELL